MARITKVRRAIGCRGSEHVADFRVWTCTDHNIIFTSYFAADEAETLDRIYADDEDAIAGVYS